MSFPPQLKLLKNTLGGFLATKIAFSIFAREKQVFLVEVSIVNNCPSIQFKKNWKSSRDT